MSTKCFVSPTTDNESSAIKRTEKAFDTLEMIVQQLKLAQENKHATNIRRIKQTRVEVTKPIDESDGKITPTEGKRTTYLQGALYDNNQADKLTTNPRSPVTKKGRVCSHIPQGFSNEMQTN